MNAWALPSLRGICSFGMPTPGLGYPGLVKPKIGYGLCKSAWQTGDVNEGDHYWAVVWNTVRSVLVCRDCLSFLYLFYQVLHIKYGYLQGMKPK